MKPQSLKCVEVDFIEICLLDRKHKFDVIYMKSNPPTLPPNIQIGNGIISEWLLGRPLRTNKQTKMTKKEKNDILHLTTESVVHIDHHRKLSLF